MKVSRLERDKAYFDNTSIILKDFAYVLFFFFCFSCFLVSIRLCSFCSGFCFSAAPSLILSLSLSLLQKYSMIFHFTSFIFLRNDNENLFYTLTRGFKVSCSLLTSPLHYNFPSFNPISHIVFFYFSARFWLPTNWRWRVIMACVLVCIFVCVQQYTAYWLLVTHDMRLSIKLLIVNRDELNSLLQSR